MQTAAVFAQLRTRLFLQTATFNQMLRNMRVGSVSSMRLESQRLRSAQLRGTLPMVLMRRAFRVVQGRQAALRVIRRCARRVILGRLRHRAELRSVATAP